MSKKSTIAIMLLFSILITSNSLAETFKSKIQINPKQKIPGKVTNKTFGGFIEFLYDYVNGPMGMWAQEFENRGFDEEAYWGQITKYWLQYLSVPNQSSIELLKGGYNPNGKYYIRVNSQNDKAISGISQQIYYTDSTSLEFYVYLKSDNNLSKAKLYIYDTTQKIELRKYDFPNLSTEWQKYSLKINPIKDYTKLKFLICLEGKGQLDIDEASCMPTNNIMGFRKEHIDLLDQWNMGLFRYPGGEFADNGETIFTSAIGDIDKRKAPLYGNGVKYQRMDFGYHEYYELCKRNKILPYLTVNINVGVDSIPGQCIEYCNSDTNTFWGRKRKENGSIEPFNVKYWEMGNEEWLASSATKYGKKIEKIIKQIKDKDSSSKTLMAWEYWTSNESKDTILKYANNKCEYFGTHPLWSFDLKEKVSEYDMYISTMILTDLIPSIAINFKNWLYVNNYYPQTKIANTEWALNYEGWPYVLLDTGARSASMGAGLYYALAINNDMNISDIMDISCVTNGFGFIRKQINSKNQRVIFALPSYYALTMISNHFGEDLFQIDVNTSKFTPVKKNNLYYNENVPWLTSICTASKDSFFVNIVNRNPDDSSLIELDIPNYIVDTAMVYQLNSDHYMDQNTVEKPYNIVPKQFKITNAKKFVVPKLSLTVLAIAKNELIDTNKNSINETLDFNIYPNPSKNIVNIVDDFDSNSISKIDLYNCFGSIIPLNEWNFRIEDNLITLNLSKLAKGFYVIKITSQNGMSKLGKIIKE